MLPITDLLSFGVFVWSFFGSSVTWKRASYTVLGDGTLAHPPPTAAMGPAAAW